MSKVRANSKEIALIYNKLAEVGEVVGEGLYRYKLGWSDERVAQEVAPRLTKYAVNHIRQSDYGMLYKMPVPKAEVVPNSDLAALKQRVDELETLVLQQGETINKLQSERIRSAMPQATLKSNGIVQSSLPLIAR